MEKLQQTFRQVFNSEAQVTASAPGRLEILGNHTDYNEGVVLSCAVDQRTSVAMQKSGSDLVELYDMRDDLHATFDVSTLDMSNAPKWAGYPAGVVSELRKRGMSVPGFKAVIDSTVPLSAGMSSSAAFETAVLFALMKLNDLKISKADSARIGQGVENNFLGLKTGLLDQFSSIFGVKDSFILSDFRSVEVLETVSMQPGASILVVNSMVKHNLVDSEYNVRREACESAAAKLATRHSSVKTLRDVSSELLESEKNILTDIEYRRAKHVVGECERVMLAVQLLKENKISEFGQLWWDSHESSRVNFENSTPELDKLIELSKQIPGCLGARLSGGGFGGISIHLVKDDMLDSYQAQIAEQYKNFCGKLPELIVCKPGAGAE